MCVSRRNWLHLGGDGALHSTAVLLSVAASLRRHGLDPWAYLKHVLTELPARPPKAKGGPARRSIRWLSPANGSPAHPAPSRQPRRTQHPIVRLRALLGTFPQSSFRIVPVPRLLMNSELLLLPNRSK